MKAFPVRRIGRFLFSYTIIPFCAFLLLVSFRTRIPILLFNLSNRWRMVRHCFGYCSRMHRMYDLIVVQIDSRSPPYYTILGSKILYYPKTRLFRGEACLDS